MPTASGAPGPAQRNLAAIDVGIIPDRSGQLLRQALQRRFASDAGRVPVRYDLAVNYTISNEGIGIQPDATATRVRVIGSASWTLSRLAPARSTITTGSARAVDAFNVLDLQFFAADLNNEQVQSRVADRIADQITLQLAVYFRRQAAHADD